MNMICVFKNTEKDKPELIENEFWFDKKGIADFYSEDLNFTNRSFKMLWSFREKLCYLIAEYCNDDSRRDEFLREAKDAMKTCVPGFTDFGFRKRTEEIFEDENGNRFSEREMEAENNDESIFEQTYRCERLGISNIEFSDDGDGFSYLDSAGNQHNGFYVESKKYLYYGSTGKGNENLVSSFLEKEGISVKDFLEKRKYAIVINEKEFEKYQNRGFINKDKIEKIWKGEKG